MPPEQSQQLQQPGVAHVHAQQLTRLHPKTPRPAHCQDTSAWVHKYGTMGPSNTHSECDCPVPSTIAMQSLSVSHNCNGHGAGMPDTRAEIIVVLVAGKGLLAAEGLWPGCMW